MTATEAQDLLKSDNYHDRLKAARYFAEDPQATMAATLIEALTREQVVPVKRVLAEAVASIKLDDFDRGATFDGLTAEVMDEIRQAAIIQATGTVLHEIGPIIGLALVKARKEIPEFDKSETHTQLRRLVSLLDAFREWNSAAREPKEEEFDLAVLVKRVANAERTKYSNVRIEIGGPAPFPTIGDQLLIELALANGLRNALEASDAAQASKPVIISWDRNLENTWLAVLDNGRGLPPGGKHGDIGISTKKGHLGMGLAVANQAVKSLGGKLSVQPRAGGGVRFEFNWLSRTAK